MPASHSHASTLPLRAALICLAVGMLLGSSVGRSLPAAPEHARLLEGVCEAALIVCLFCTGLGAPIPLEWPAWRTPARLALITLPATMLLIAAAGNLFLGLTFLQALLLGAILAPTDPVLASDVGLPAPAGQEEVRSALIAEGALSSILALPLALLSLGLMGHYDAGPLALRWVLLDVLWALPAGATLGWAVGRLGVRSLQRLGQSQPGIVEWLLLACALALAYGGALLLQANGLAAVFCTGLALAQGTRKARLGLPIKRPGGDLASATAPVARYTDWALVVVLGVLLARSEVHTSFFVFALLVLAIVRPLSARLGLAGLACPEGARQAIGWFGIRGLASLYLLMHALNEGLFAAFGAELTAISLAVLGSSIALHGLSTLRLLKRPLDQEG